VLLVEMGERAQMIIKEVIRAHVREVSLAKIVKQVCNIDYDLLKIEIENYPSRFLKFKKESHQPFFFKLLKKTYATLVALRILKMEKEICQIYYLMHTVHLRQTFV